MLCARWLRHTVTDRQMRCSTKPQVAPLAPVLSNLIGKGQAVCPRDSDSDSDSDLERASDSDSGPPSDAWHDTVDSAKKAMRALLLLGAHAPTHAFVYDGGVQVVGACAAHVKVSARAFLLGENLSRLPGLMVVLVWCSPPPPAAGAPASTPLHALGMPWVWSPWWASLQVDHCTVSRRRQAAPHPGRWWPTCATC